MTEKNYGKCFDCKNFRQFSKCGMCKYLPSRSPLRVNVELKDNYEKKDNEE